MAVDVFFPRRCVRCTRHLPPGLVTSWVTQVVKPTYWHCADGHLPDNGYAARQFAHTVLDTFSRVFSRADFVREAK